MKTDGINQNLVLVKMKKSLSPEQKVQLASHSTVITYLPRNAWLVSLDRNAHKRGVSELTSLSFIQWIYPYLPEMKVDWSTFSPWQIQSETMSDRDSSGLTLRVLTLPMARRNDLFQPEVVLKNIHYINSFKSFSLYEIDLSTDRVHSVVSGLIASDLVLWVEPKSPKVIFNSQSVWVCQSGLSGGETTSVFDHGINGQGVIVGVLDTGVDADSCYFYDSNEGLPDETLNLNQRKILVYQDFGSEGNWDSQNHGTHVAGTIAGDQSPFGTHTGSDGMAPGAKLVIQDGGYAVDPYADMPFLPTDYYHDIFERARDMGARIHSNSWGAHEDYGTNNYTVECQMTDQFMWDYKDFLIVFAAGNSGHASPTISDPATAKNSIAVAATNPGSSAGTLASFSSGGPVQDGRLKPDVAAPGSSIVSAGNDGNINSFNCTTRSMSGTSMACPTVAGLSALVYQYYQDGFYPTGASVPADSMTPSSALVKATLIISGEPMGGESTFPNTSQGWGRVTLDDAFFFPGDPEAIQAVDQTAGLETGQHNEYTVQVRQDHSLKVVLVWTDYPSTPAASINLVNDLNLTVTGSAGTFKGNVFAGSSSTAGGSYDAINNVEMVLLKSIAAGTYTIRIDGFAIPQGPQPYALLTRVSPTPAEVDVLNEGPLSLGTHEEQLYSFTIPEDVISLNVTTTGNNGDADLYVRHGGAATTSLYDAKSTSPLSNESVSIANPAAGTWTALIYAYESFTDCQISATYIIMPDPCLTMVSLLAQWPGTDVTVRELIESLDCESLK
jgi:subtilisin family serine protease